MSVKRVYPIDEFLLFRYKSLFSKNLSEIKSLKGKNRQKAKCILINAFREKIYQIVVADQQVFLRKASVEASLDRYSSKMLKL